MRSLRAVALTAVLTVSASLLVTSPAAHARPTWVTPEVLGAEARYFDMDVNAAGDAVAAWTGGGVLKASYRPAGRDWSRPVVLTRGMGEVERGPAIPVRALVDARGRAAVVTYKARAGDTFVATRTARGQWREDDHAPSAGGDWSSFPTADMDAAGNLVLTWVDTDDFSGDDESIAWRKPSGDWSYASGGGGNFDLVAHDATATIARNGNGNVHDDGLHVQTSRLGDREVTPWRNLRPGAHIGSFPLIEGNARGDLVLVAVEGENDPSRVLLNAGPGQLVVMTKAAGEDWVDASAEVPQTDIGHPAVAIGNGGEIVVTYRRSSDGRVGAVMGHVGSADLTAPVTLADTSGKFPARPTINDKGAVLVTWSTANARAVRVARRSDTGKWSSLGRVRGDTLGGHLVRAYPNGMFTTLHVDAGALWWSDYVDDSTGPRTVMRAPNRDTSTSRSIPVRWYMTDALSRPASADVRVRSGRPEGALGAWTVWKRQTISERATFRGRPARRYCFSARGHDRVGNTGRWSESRCTTTPRG